MSLVMQFPGLTESRRKNLQCTSKENKERLVAYRVKKTLVDLEESQETMRWNGFNRMQQLQRWVERR